MSNDLSKSSILPLRSINPVLIVGLLYLVFVFEDIAWLCYNSGKKEILAMEETEMPENNIHCSCPDWKTNIPQLNSLLLHEMVRGREYKGTPFRFCPWCGRQLADDTGYRNEKLLEENRQRIKADFFGGDEWGMPQTPNMLVAARSVTDYQQRTADVLGTLDLMLYFVEMGTQFTDQYGDIDEPFYEGLELMLDDFCGLLLANPQLYEEGDLARRVERLERDAGGMGWGYGDYVTEQVDKIEQHFAAAR